MPNGVAESLLPYLAIGDIIEVTCVGFYHYCIYLGEGLCAHITKKGNYEKAQAVEHFLTAVGESPLRVTNFEEKAKQLGLLKRNTWEIVRRATEGLETDSNGRLKPDAWRNVPYDLVFNNCEIFVTYCRYECPDGWSEQSINVWKALTGAVGTLPSVALAGCAKAIHDENVTPIAKVGLVAVAPVYAAADIAVGTVSDVFNPITSTVKNFGREGGTVSRERECSEGKYETGLGVGYKAESTKESKHVHWSVLSAGVSSPSASTEAYLGMDGVCAEMKAELARGEAAVGPVTVGVGLQADTGICMKKGKVGASLLGFGGEIGENGIKLKTPVADASCCIS